MSGKIFFFFLIYELIGVVIGDPFDCDFVKKLSFVK